MQAARQEPNSTQLDQKTQQQEGDPHLHKKMCYHSGDEWGTINSNGTPSHWESHCTYPFCVGGFPVFLQQRIKMNGLPCPHKTSLAESYKCEPSFMWRGRFLPAIYSPAASLTGVMAVSRARAVIATGGRILLCPPSNSSL